MLAINSKYSIFNYVMDNGGGNKANGLSNNAGMCIYQKSNYNKLVLNKYFFMKKLLKNKVLYLHFCWQFTY